MSDLISRQDAIDALWKAMFKYEDETEQKFQASGELDDWFMHRIFVQNMSDIDRQTILDLPSVQPEQKYGHWIEKSDFDYDNYYECSVCHEPWVTIEGTPMDNFMNYCPKCGAKMDEVKE